jgi:uncharacterized protein YlxW (UPF0749 family)
MKSEQKQNADLKKAQSEARKEKRRADELTNEVRELRQETSEKDDEIKALHKQLGAAKKIKKDEAAHHVPSNRELAGQVLNLLADDARVERVQALLKAKETVTQLLAEEE